MKKLYRLPHEGTVAGVIAGFADYFGIDVTILRVLFVLFVLVTGIFPGVIAYILAIFIMPVKRPITHEQKSEDESNQ
ncbi:MAG: Phage shock protein C [Parcubacteria group bacterium GW2011_GWA2_51_10]|nr:MAG: Phage shock protein C [Parcubacteria group bacterium GW2011_GWA2_51_10]